MAAAVTWRWTTPHTTYHHNFLWPSHFQKSSDSKQSPPPPPPPLFLFIYPHPSYTLLVSGGHVGGERSRQRPTWGGRGSAPWEVWSMLADLTIQVSGGSMSRWPLPRDRPEHGVWPLNPAGVGTGRAQGPLLWSAQVNPLNRPTWFLHGRPGTSSWRAAGPYIVRQKRKIGWQQHKMISIYEYSTWRPWLTLKRNRVVFGYS